MIDACKVAGLPDPVIEELASGIQVTFQKDIFNEAYLHKLDINERQIRALLYLKKNGFITNSVYQGLKHLGKTVSTIDLQDLVEKKLIQQEGKAGRGIKYTLKK